MTRERRGEEKEKRKKKRSGTNGNREGELRINTHRCRHN
jgi:hypothetical protein